MSQWHTHFSEVLQLLTPTSKTLRKQAAPAAKDKKKGLPRSSRALPSATLCLNLETLVLKFRVEQEEWIEVC